MSESVEPNPIPEENFNELLDSMKPAAKARQVRQGLPTEFRMRHDAHYVESLAASPSGAQDAVEPSVVPTSSALRDMCHEFEGLASCFNLIERGARPLRERLGLSLARIGVQRSVRYAQNLRVLLEEQHPFHAELRLDELVREAFLDLREELRLTETTLIIEAPAPSAIAAIRGDVALIRAALRACAGAAISLIEMAGQPGDLQISSFAAGESMQCGFQQNAYTLEQRQVQKIFDMNAASRNDRMTAVALNAARRVAQLHGGDLEVRRNTFGGSMFVFRVSKGIGQAVTAN